MKLDNIARLWRSTRQEQPDLRASRLQTARAIDAALSVTEHAPRPAFAEGLLRGLDLPMSTSLLRDSDPYVFVSQVKVYNPLEGSTRRPEAFRVVDDTQFRPSLTHAEAAVESERVAQRLHDFALRSRRYPDMLLEKQPAFDYRVSHGPGTQPEIRRWPEVCVLEYALRERNAVVAGLIAFELATLARSPRYGAAHDMLLKGIAVAVEIEDGPYASMLLMALAATHPAGWLHDRMNAALDSHNPVAVTLTYFRELAGKQLQLESEAWKAHWLRHDPSVRDFIYTCVVDVLLYAAALRLHRACGTEPIHRNHFMHGTMVLTELKSRVGERVDAQQNSALGWAKRLVEIVDQDPKHCDLHGKISLLTTCLDDTKLSPSFLAMT